MKSKLISKSEVSFTNDDDIYYLKCDSGGTPFLKRIEKYSNLPEDEFISIEYIFSNGKKILENYVINKLGKLKNKLKNTIIKSTLNRGYECVCLLDTSKEKHYVPIHRLVASTFLENPDYNTYSIVNHIDHNKANNKLDNLEWTTVKGNMDRESGKCSLVSEDKLIQYIALNNKNEIGRAHV